MSDQAQIQSLEEKIDYLHNENTRLRHALERAEARSHGSEQKASTLERKVDGLTFMKKQLIGKLEAWRTASGVSQPFEVTTLKDEVSNLNAELVKTTAASKQFENQKEQLEIHVKDLFTYLSSWNTSSKNLSDRVPADDKSRFGLTQTDLGLKAVSPKDEVAAEQESKPVSTPEEGPAKPASKATSITGEKKPRLKSAPSSNKKSPVELSRVSIARAPSGNYDLLPDLSPKPTSERPLSAQRGE